jgi:ferritin-like metal-binding protein YciE
MDRARGEVNSAVFRERNGHSLVPGRRRARRRRDPVESTACGTEEVSTRSIPKTLIEADTGATMATETLHELYISELQDLFDAEQQIVTALSALAANATDDDLKKAFERQLERSRIHVERLKWLFDERDFPQTTSRTTAVQALIRDADRRVQTMVEPYLRDAALIAAAQLVAHYEMAAYGCTRTYAQLLGDHEAAELLQQTLDDEREADEELTQIATIINGLATPDVEEEWRPSHSLRYIGARDLERAAHEYATYEIRSSTGASLGKTDGFLVDASGSPSYLVVEATGGLFVGRRRFVVPVGEIAPQGTNRTFTIDFDKEKLQRYPRFHRDAFAMMTDDESQRCARMLKLPDGTL